MSKTHYLLIGDIGGTNGRFALHASKDNNKDPLYANTYLNSNYITAEKFSFTEILEPFLTECFEKVSGLSEAKSSDVVFVACFAVAGPVKDNCAYLTNIQIHWEEAQSFGTGRGASALKRPLVIDGNEVQKSEEGYLEHIRHVKLINDFQGQGYGLLSLDMKKECIELVDGSIDRIDPDAPKCCVGAGTGLGECFLTPSEIGYTCYASEGGHVDFSPRSDLEFEMLKFLREKFQGSLTRISVERVVSGKGLANVYDFVCHKYPDKIDDDVHEEFLKAGDMQGKIVAINAHKKGSLCELAMEIFLGAYGAEVGNAALKFLPRGGLFVAGGLTPKNIHYIQDKSSHFLKGYHDKGRLAQLLFDEIPLFAVMTEDLGLRGALYCAVQELKKIQV